MPRIGKNQETARDSGNDARIAYEMQSVNQARLQTALNGAIKSHRIKQYFEGGPLCSHVIIFACQDVLTLMRGVSVIQGRASNAWASNQTGLGNPNTTHNDRCPRINRRGEVASPNTPKYNGLGGSTLYMLYSPLILSPPVVRTFGTRGSCKLVSDG